MISQVERVHPFISLLPKAPTGITGLDEITGGGLPKGRPTIVCGGAGSGKTLLGIEFLVRGAAEYDEPGLFVAFEETPEELTVNVASLGFDIPGLVADKKLFLDHIYIDRSEIEETGEYDLEGLFIRLGYLIDSIGAKRVVLDTVEALFGALSDSYILRSELRRLFNWLKQKGVTAVITAERGDGTLTRHGLEEYVSDCVILLDHRVTEQVSTRRLRIVKYRGTAHGTNEYPFLIDQDGFSVLPITSVGLDHQVSEERISTGMPQLDELLEGRGLYRGSSVLISGTAGSGKSSMAAHFVSAACQRGERCLYLASEESRHQIIRNMRSIGVDLQPWVDADLLHFHNARPTASSLEMYLAIAHRIVSSFQPEVVVIDPITNFNMMGSPNEVKATLMRLIDFLKVRHITTVMTSLTAGGDALEQTEMGISSLIDTWILLRDVELNGERNRLMYLLKSRGMAHSNQLREFLLTDNGIQLVDVYIGSEGVLTGSARVAQEAKEGAAALVEAQEVERLRLNLERKRKVLDAQIAALQANFDAEAEELYRIINQKAARDQQIVEDRAEMARSRSLDRAEIAGETSNRSNGQ